MPNQRDVALLAGVSSASVSRYLQDPSLVREKTGRKIEEAIRSTGYRIDAAARTLKTGKSYHVGILSPGFGPYYWLLFQSIQLELALHDYHTTILFTKTPESRLEESQAKVLPFIRTNRVEGFIFLTTETAEDRATLEEIRRHHEKIVIVDAGRLILEAGEGIRHLEVANREAGRRAADLLWEKGHRSFLHIRGDLRFSPAVERLEGFTGRIRELGGDVWPEHILPGDFQAEKIAGLVAALPRTVRDFTAVFSANDSMALAFIHACARTGRRCPEDYELIGFDNNLEYTPYTAPALTTFEQPLVELGVAAARALLDQLESAGRESGRAGDRGKVRFETKLVVRESFRPA